MSRKLTTSADMYRKLDSPGVAIETQSSGYELWGHALIFTDDAVSCNTCDKEVQIPKLLRETSGFREVVYRMRALGEFKKSYCSDLSDVDRSVPDTGTLSDIHKRYVRPQQDLYKYPKTVTDNSGGGSLTDMYFTPGTGLNINGNEYAYNGGDSWIVYDKGRPSSMLTTQKLLQKEGSALKDKMPQEIVEKYESRTTSSSGQWRLPTDGTISDGTQQTSLDDVHIADDDTVTNSMATKLAKRLSDSKNHFLNR